LKSLTKTALSDSLSGTLVLVGHNQRWGDRLAEDDAALGRVDGFDEDDAIRSFPECGVEHRQGNKEKRVGRCKPRHPRDRQISSWSWFRGLGLPNDDFFSEFTNGKRESFAQRTWEMLLARHLHSQGHAIVCRNGGPDFLFDYRGVRVWVEAVAPEPKGLRQTGSILNSRVLAASHTMRFCFAGPRPSTPNGRSCITTALWAS
jgi:hypothetical protein